MASTKILALAITGAAAETEKPKGIMDMAGFAQNPVKEMPDFPAVEQKFDEQNIKSRYESQTFGQNSLKIFILY